MILNPGFQIRWHDWWNLSHLNLWPLGLALLFNTGVCEVFMPSLKEAYKKRKYFGCLSSGRGFKDISKLFELSDCTVTMWGKILMIASLSRTDCPSKFIPQSLPNCPAQDLQATVVTVCVKVHLCTIRRI